MSSTTELGTAGIQGRLWNVRVDEWAQIQEAQTRPAFEAALDALGVGPQTRLLDVGCGAGLALRLAADRGADVSGLDASEGMLAHARRRVPGAPLVAGEIEDLPYDDGSFDAVTGFNSFQYAAHPATALAEAGRVVAATGRVLLLNWAPADRCDAGAYLQGLAGLMPPPPPGAPGPFALSDEDALRALFDQARLDVQTIDDVRCRWAYPDAATAIAGLECAGPVVRVAEHAGWDAVHQVTRSFLEPFRTNGGGYALTNTFRFVVGTPRG
ncbi:MAG: class I SAM-dependent methyltransferase [Solirubrobacteraceae bacterium]